MFHAHIYVFGGDSQRCNKNYIEYFINSIIFSHLVVYNFSSSKTLQINCTLKKNIATYVMNNDKLDICVINNNLATTSLIFSSQKEELEKCV